MSDYEKDKRQERIDAMQMGAGRKKDHDSPHRREKKGPG